MFGQVSAFWMEKREELGNLRNIFAHDGWLYHLLLVSRNTSMIIGNLRTTTTTLSTTTESEVPCTAQARLTNFVVVV